MRLLDVHTLELRTFYGDAIPQYAILSHNWLHDGEEVTFQQIQHPEECRGILGFRKVELLCDQAKKDGFAYAWIDTCCIDKANSSELSEAINSMFEWYRRSKVCYAYLGDIDYTTHSGDVVMGSRWWSRAWTLQELIAPRRVVFFDRNWVLIGTKRYRRIAKRITDVTGIPREVLRVPRFMFTKSIAQRMSWAAKRQATRAEDVAYSLLGIFDVHMPMQYGEGTRAFVRLQSEILKSTNDLSLFAWSYLEESTVKEIFGSEKEFENHDIFGGFAESAYGMYAPHPKCFERSGTLASCGQHAPSTAVTETNGAVYLELHLIPYARSPTSGLYYIGLLPCVDVNFPQRMIAIVLKATKQPKCFTRGSTIFHKFTFTIKARLAFHAEVTSICIQRPQATAHSLLNTSLDMHRTVTVESNARADTLRLIAVPDMGLWNKEDMTLQLSRTDHPGMLFELVPQHSKRTRRIKICPYLLEHSDGTLGNFVVISEMQHDQNVEWPWDFSGFNVSTEAVLLLPDAKIRAIAESRRIFHHLVTDLTIQVDHHKVTDRSDVAF